MIVERLRALWPSADAVPVQDADAVAGDDGTGRPSGAAGSKLFSCPECDVVYVAVEKDVCSNCRSDVREVPSSLTGE
jgi:hypothetical protein